MKKYAFAAMMFCSSAANAADTTVNVEPQFPPENYTITISGDEANLLVAVFQNAEIAQVKWQPLFNKISHQIGVENDAARKIHDDWVTEQNKKNAPKK